MCSGVVCSCTLRRPSRLDPSFFLRPVKPQGSRLVESFYRETTSLPYTCLSLEVSLHPTQDCSANSLTTLHLPDPLPGLPGPGTIRLSRGVVDRHRRSSCRGEDSPVPEGRVSRHLDSRVQILDREVDGGLDLRSTKPSLTETVQETHN